MSLKGVLVLMLLLSFAESQNIPASYTYTTADIISVNGSSATGHCSNVTTNSDGTTTCTAPSSSVLFDGLIPTLTGLDGNMWASQLLTLQPTTSMTEITSTFNNPNFRLERLEVVMFNCPQRGIAAQNIRLFDTIEIGIISPTITSCDSLVRVCTPASSFASSLSLQFSPRPGSEWVYLAELSFWGNSATCPPDIIKTDPSSTTTTTTEMLTTTSTTSTVPDASSMPPGFTIVIVVVLTSLLFILVGIVVAVFILWRCYCAKHHKHNNTQHTTLEQSQHTSSSQTQEEMDNRPCELGRAELGASGTESLPRAQQYTQVDNNVKKEIIEADKTDSLPLVEENILPERHSPMDQFYSPQVNLKKKEKKQKHVATTQTYSSESHTRVDLVYAQVDKKKKKIQKDEGKTTQLHMSETDILVDQLYAQVDKKKKKRQKDEETTQLHTSETDTPMDQFCSPQVNLKKKEKKQKHVATTQTYSSESHTRVDLLYAQVDKKKKKIQKDEGKTTQLHMSETDILVDQLYAQVDKKKKKRQKDEETTQLHSSETDTPMDQFCSPQVNLKKKEKKQKHVATTQTYLSESDTRVDLLYAQVDKKKKKIQKGEGKTTQLHTSETDIPVDQLYAQVDKKKKRQKDEETTQLHTSETKSQLLMEELQ